MKKLLILTIILILLLSATSYAEQFNTYQGRRLFLAYCFLCHGMDGKGDGPLRKKLKLPPADLTDKSRIDNKTDTELYNIIDGSNRHGAFGITPANNGDISEQMPKWNQILSPQSIEALVSYIRFISQSKNPLIGDPTAGEEVYRKYCALCHGKNGKGDGIMLRVIPVSPTDYTNVGRMNSLSNQDLIDIISNGRGEGSFMPGWKGSLSQHEIESVVSYIRLLSFTYQGE